MIDDKRAWGILQTIVVRLRSEDFAYTVEVELPDRVWDVYRFTANGRQGMIAFRLAKKPDGTEGAEIAICKAGEYTETEMRDLIRQAYE